MAIPIMNPADVATPSAGEVTLFLNSLDSNKLYYKSSDGEIHLLSEGDADDCCCEIAKVTMEAITCALKKGAITMADFTTFIGTGMTVTGTSTDDGAGNKTCTVTIVAAT